MNKKSALQLAVCVVLAASSLAHADQHGARFYVVTNKADGNTIMGYMADATGQYQAIGEFATGGKGTGDLEVPALKKDDTHPLANGDDPLISAGSLVATKDHSKLIAVNPGSGTISLMGVGKDGRLSALSQAPASDKFPLSVAVYGDTVAVASVGLDNSNGSITTIKIVGDKLVAKDENRRDLKARPSTIAFSSDGEHVVVNELVTGKIHSYAVTQGVLGAKPTSTVNSPRNAAGRFQAIPVGFALRGQGKDDVLLMSEARFLTPEFGLREGSGQVKLSPKYSWQTSSISTYQMTNDGKLSLVSGDVLTGAAVEGGQIANCWVTTNADGSILWAANALSSSISSFRIRLNGTASLINDQAYKMDSEDRFFSDIELSADGKQVYQLIGNRGEVMIFNVGEDGALAHVQTVGGMPALGTYGLVAM